MAMEVSKGDVLQGFQKLLGSIMVPALQKQEVHEWFDSNNEHYIETLSLKMGVSVSCLHSVTENFTTPTNHC